MKSNNRVNDIFIQTTKIEKTLRQTGKYQIKLLNDNTLNLVFDGFLFYGLVEINGRISRTKTHTLSKDNLLKVLKFMGLNRYGSQYILSNRYTIESV